MRPLLYDRRFRAVRKATRGYLKPWVYERLYRAARAAGEGVMVDIGPGQGASAVAIGLGVRDSGKRATTVYSIELGRYSRALRSDTDVEANRAVLLGNLERFGVAATAAVLMGAVHEVADRVPADRPVTLLFVDADGALDRDLGLFYARMPPGAFVIVDDCEDKLDETMVRFSDAEVAAHLAKLERQGKPGRRLRDLTPLGKHHTTYRMVEHLVGAGWLVRDALLGNTFFGRKAPDVALGTPLDRRGLEAVRDEIHARFEALRARRAARAHSPAT